MPMFFTNLSLYHQGLIVGFISALSIFLLLLFLVVKYKPSLLSGTILQEMPDDIEQNHALLSQKDYQEELEQKVQERTLELNIAFQELESLNKELEQKNTFDDLTGLYNRRFYNKKILAEYRRSKRNLTPLSLVVIDIDHFKQVNDNHGHQIGDECLIWLSQHIKDTLNRSSDLGFRYGGEEFCLILPDTNAQGAFQFAEKLRSIITSKPFIFQNASLVITISCGISTYQQQTKIQSEHLFLGADKALYQAKHAGRNQSKLFDLASLNLSSS